MDSHFASDICAGQPTYLVSRAKYQRCNDWKFFWEQNFLNPNFIGRHIVINLIRRERVGDFICTPSNVTSSKYNRPDRKPISAHGLRSINRTVCVRPHLVFFFGRATLKEPLEAREPRFEDHWIRATKNLITLFFVYLSWKSIIWVQVRGVHFFVNG